MNIDKIKKTLNAKIDNFYFEADFITDSTIKFFLYRGNEYFGNRFVGYYNPKDETIRALYYNSHMDYRGKEPTARQQIKIKRYCKKLIKAV